MCTSSRFPHSTKTEWKCSQTPKCFTDECTTDTSWLYALPVSCNVTARSCDNVAEKWQHDVPWVSLTVLNLYVIQRTSIPCSMRQSATTRALTLRMSPSLGKVTMLVTLSQIYRSACHMWPSYDFQVNICRKHSCWYLLKSIFIAAYCLTCWTSWLCRTCQISNNN